MVRENVLDVEDYLQAADLGLITSDSESFCMSILEAMFFECPSVATHVGGIPEVVENGVTGLIVPPGDAEQLSSAVEKLIQNLDLRKSLGRAAKQQAQEKFSAEQIIPRYELLYRSVRAEVVPC